MRGGRGVRLVALTVLTAAILLASVMAAYANGDIAGTLMRGNGGAMNGGRAVVYHHLGSYAGQCYTSNDGTWAVNVPAGDYDVLFVGINAAYAQAYWRGAGSLTPVYGLAQSVTVTDDATVTCDATLPLSGTITGTATSALTHANLGVAINVYIWDAPTSQWQYAGYSGVSGAYNYYGLFPGTYKISASRTGYVTDYYNGKSSLESADTTVLAAGATVTYSPALVPEGTSSGVQGVLHRANGDPVPNVDQYVYGVSAGGAPQWVGKWARTRSDGSWDATLAPGTYKVLMWGGFGWAQGWWAADELSPLSSLADTVTVSLGATETCDATAPVAASFSGTIRTHAAGLILPSNVACGAYMLNPSTGQWEQAYGSMNYGDGTYAFGRLLPGTYKFLFEEDYWDRYLTQWWDAKPDLNTATSVTLASGQALADRDVTMSCTVESQSIAGVGRVETAIMASRSMYSDGEPPADAVIITTGWNWPDALGASALAGALNAPVLLNAPVPQSMPATLDAEVARLKRNGATKAYILGDGNAVSSAVEMRLRQIFGGETNVIRLGGVGRYATSLAIAGKVKTQQAGAWDGVVFLAKGTDYPDALAASPLAAKKRWPVLLAESDGHGGLSTRLRQWLAANATTKVIILGSANAIPSSMATSVATIPGIGWGKVERWAGADRVATAVDVAQHSVDTAGGLSFTSVGVATAYGYPDALCGGAFLAKHDAPLLLTVDALPLRPALASKLASLSPTVEVVRFLGGPPAVRQTVRDKMVDSLE